MDTANTDVSFYKSLTTYSDFAELSDSGSYSPLPDDWWIGTSDVRGSTKAVEDGQYKTVNMIGAAVISAQINTHNGASFPYIFGGDGASFAIPPSWKDRASDALAAVRLWAHEEFGMELRVGMVPLSKVRAAGFDVKVARFQASEGVDYAMFFGGGLNWAEMQMKAGEPRRSGGGPWVDTRSHGIVLSVEPYAQQKRCHSVDDRYAKRRCCLAHVHPIRVAPA